MFGSIDATTQRIAILDSMRGFALCGIIFANLVSFTGFYSLSFAEIKALPWLDRGVLFAIDFLVEGKFYSVFATLLGAGFWLQYRRFRRDRRDFSIFWLRRMAVLFVIGITHMYFVWHGDILTLYSLLGVCLLLFVRVKDRVLLPCIGLFLFFPLLIHALLMATHGHAFWSSVGGFVYNLKSALGYQGVTLLALRAEGSAIDVFWGNILSAIPRPMSYLKTGRPFQVFGQFLLGVYLARVYLQGKAPIPGKRQIVMLLLAGSVLNLIYAYIKYLTGSPFGVDELGLFQGVVYHFGCTLMAFGYMALLYRLSHRGVRFENLARLGRMALTMYLMQSILCVLVFYAYGLAWMGKVPFYSVALFGTVILSIQFMFARFWLGRFQFGPMEYLWRRLSYHARPGRNTETESRTA